MCNNIFPIGIAVSPPSWFKGASMKSLAPKVNMLKMEASEYDKLFRQILDSRDPAVLYRILEDYGDGKDVALLCYEKDVSVCHRKDVGEWFAKNLDIEVEEFDPDTLNQKDFGIPVVSEKFNQACKEMRENSTKQMRISYINTGDLNDLKVELNQWEKILKVQLILGNNNKWYSSQVAERIDLIKEAIAWRKI